MTRYKYEMVRWAALIPGGCSFDAKLLFCREEMAGRQGFEPRYQLVQSHVERGFSRFRPVSSYCTNTLQVSTL
jgi:hypothetical protein